jgi:transposase
MAKIFTKKTFPVYGGKYLSRMAVHSWVKKLPQGRSKVADDARAGRPVEIATEATVQRAREFIRADRSRTIDSVATTLGCPHGLSYSIMHDRRSFGKCAHGGCPEN